MDNQIINDCEIEKLNFELVNYRKNKERLINTCQQMIEHYKKLINNYEHDISIKEIEITSNIINLCQDAEWKETKTLKKYELPNCEIVIKKSHKDIERISDEVPAEFIKEYTNTKINWQKLKTQLSILGENIILNETGEIIDFAKIILKPEKIEVKSRL